MKVLIDQNISFRIVSQISDLFPGVSHVKSLGLIDAKDFDIFMFARKEGFQAILTQDEDFYAHLLEHGTPPKIIWIRTGNCTTALLSEVLHRNAAIIFSFFEDDNADCLEIFK